MILSFFQTFNYVCWNFSRNWTKILIVGNFEKIFQKLSKDFLVQLLKTHYFRMFSKNVINHAFVFRAFIRKTQVVGNFENIFEYCIFSNIRINIGKNALFLHIVQKQLTNHSLIFCGFGPKTQIVGKF